MNCVPREANITPARVMPCVRANVCKFLVVCLFVCVCGRVCVSLWMCIPANVSFPVCVSCLNTIECLWECMCISVDVYPCDCFFSCLLCCLDTIVGTSVSPWICLLACAVFEWIWACLTVCLPESLLRTRRCLSVSLSLCVCLCLFLCIRL